MTMHECMHVHTLPRSCAHILICMNAIALKSLIVIAGEKQSVYS